MSLLRHILPLFTKYSVLQVEMPLCMKIELSQNRIWRACRFGHTLCPLHETLRFAGRNAFPQVTRPTKTPGLLPTRDLLFVSAALS